MWWKRGVDVGGCAVLFWDFFGMSWHPSSSPQCPCTSSAVCPGRQRAMCCSQCRLNRMRRSTERNVGPEEGSGNVFREARGTGQTSTEERLSCCSCGVSVRHSADLSLRTSSFFSRRSILQRNTSSIPVSV